MANSRIKDLADEQETFAEDLELACDATGFDNAKHIKSQVLAPLTKPDHLTELTGNLNHTTKYNHYVRINYAGNERCMLARYINPDTEDLTALPTGIIENGDLLEIYDISQHLKTYISWSGFINRLIVNSSVLATIDSEINSYANSAFILGKIQTITLEEELSIDETKMCDITFTRIGNMVTLMIADFQTTGSGTITNYVIPSGFRPFADCRSSGTSIGTWFSVAKNTGAIYLEIDGTSHPRPFLTYQISAS